MTDFDKLRAELLQILNDLADEVRPDEGGQRRLRERGAPWDHFRSPQFAFQVVLV